MFPVTLSLTPLSFALACLKFLARTIPLTCNHLFAGHWASQVLTWTGFSQLALSLSFPSLLICLSCQQQPSSVFYFGPLHIPPAAPETFYSLVKQAWNFQGTFTSS